MMVSVLKSFLIRSSNETFFLGSGKGAAMVACVAERCLLRKPVPNDAEQGDCERAN